MSQESSIAKNLSVMTLSIGVTQVIALALNMLMPRIFGPEKMGVFFFAQSFALMFFAFLPLGLSTYISRTIPPKPDHVKDVLWTIIWLQCVTALVIFAAMFGALLWQKQPWETIVVTMLMGGFSAIFTFQKDIFQKIFVILGEVVMISRLSVLIKIILVGGSLIILYTAPSIAWIAGMHLLSEAFGLVYLLHRAMKSNFIQLTRRAPYLVPMLKISLPFYIAGVLNQAFGQIDIFMLSRFSSKIEVGYYGSAYKIIGVCLFLIPVFQNAITPVMSKAHAEDQAKFTHLTKDYLRILMVASLPLAVGLTVFGDLLSALINGPQFAPAFRTVCFLTPILLMMYMNVFVGGALYLASSGKKLSMIFIGAGIINFGLDYLLIPWGLATFGPGGAGIAVSFATFGCEVFVFGAMIYMLPQKILSPRILWSAFIIFLPSWVGMYFHESLQQMAFWQRVLLFLLFIPYAFATRLVNQSDVERLRQALPQRFRRS